MRSLPMDRRHNPCRDYIIHSMGHYLCIVMPGDLRLRRKFSFQEVAVSHPGGSPPLFFENFFEAEVADYQRIQRIRQGIA